MLENQNIRKEWLFYCRELNCNLKTEKAYYYQEDLTKPLIICVFCYQISRRHKAIYIQDYITELETIQGHLINLHTIELCQNRHLFSHHNEEALNILQALFLDSLIISSQYDNAIFQSFYKRRDIFLNILKKSVQDELINNFNEYVQKMQKYQLPVEINENSFKKIDMQQKYAICSLKIVHNYLIQICQKEIYVLELKNLSIVFQTKIQDYKRLQFRYSVDLETLIIFDGNSIQFVTLNQLLLVQGLKCKNERFYIVDVAIVKDTLVILQNNYMLYISNPLKLNQIYDKSNFQLTSYVFDIYHSNPSTFIINKDELNCDQVKYGKNLAQKKTASRGKKVNTPDLIFNQLTLLDERKFSSFIFLYSENLSMGKVQKFFVNPGKILNTFQFTKVFWGQSSRFMMQERSRIIIIPIYPVGFELPAKTQNIIINFQCNKIIRKINFTFLSPQQYQSDHWIFYYDQKQVTVYDLLTGGIELKQYGKDHFEVFTEQYKIIGRRDNYFLCNHEE